MVSDRHLPKNFKLGVTGVGVRLIDKGAVMCLQSQFKDCKLAFLGIA